MCGVCWDVPNGSTEMNLYFDRWVLKWNEGDDLSIK